MSVLYEDGVGVHWLQWYNSELIFEILWYVRGCVSIFVLSSINPTISALESNRSDTLSSLFLVSIYPVRGFSGDWGLKQYQTPGRFLPFLPPPFLCSLHPLFILSTWEPARQRWAVGLHCRHSQSLSFYFHSSVLVYTSVSYSLSYYCFSHLSSFSLCLSVNPLIPPCPLRKQQLLWGIYK